MPVTTAAKWTFALALLARALTQFVQKSYSIRNLLAFATASSLPVALYSSLRYPRDFAEFPAFRTAITQFVWAPGAIVFAFFSLSNLQSGRTPRAIWAVVQNAWVVWPTWWSLVRLSAPEPVVRGSRQLLAFLWLVYLSFVTTPARSAALADSVAPAPTPDQSSVDTTASTPESTPAPAEHAPAPAEQQNSTKAPVSSLDMSSKDHLEMARARRGSPRHTPRRQPSKQSAELPESRKNQLREVFALFDKEQAGFLTREDFFKIGRALKGLRWTEACNHQKFNQINVSKSGALSEDEFLDFFKNAGMGEISEVVFDSYIHEYHEAVREASPRKIPKKRI